ncbi:hypothetical protein XENOCAPTIV_008031, partial [Xenoophorus captivus]
VSRHGYLSTMSSCYSRCFNGAEPLSSDWFGLREKAQPFSWVTLTPAPPGSGFMWIFSFSAEGRDKHMKSKLRPEPEHQSDDPTHEDPETRTTPQIRVKPGPEPGLDLMESLLHENRCLDLATFVLRFSSAFLQTSSKCNMKHDQRNQTCLEVRKHLVGK